MTLSTWPLLLSSPRLMILNHLMNTCLSCYAIVSTKLLQKVLLSNSDQFYLIIFPKSNLDSLNIAIKLGPILSKKNLKEQFGFLEGRQIHEAIEVAHEGLHSISMQKLKWIVAKIDLLKAYDRFSWVYIQMILARLRFEMPFVN